MWITVMGAGAVGTYIGARLAAAGHEVGVGHVDSLTTAFGTERVWGGVATIEAVAAAPGTIPGTTVRKSPFARLVFGRPADQVARVEGPCGAFMAAGFAAETSNDVHGTIWRKRLLTCAFNGMTSGTPQAVTGRRGRVG